MHGLILLALVVAQAEKPFGEAERPANVGGKTLQQWVKEIRDKDPGVAETAIQAVTQFGGDAQKEAGRALIARLADPDVSVRANAAYAISVLGLDPKDAHDSGVRALIRQLRDSQGIVRFRAAAALARLGTEAKTAVNELAYALGDRSAWEIRKAAAYALGSTAGDGKSTPESRAVQALTTSGLRDWCAQVRQESLNALIRLGPPAELADREAVFRALGTLLKDRDHGVVIWAHVGMMRIAGQVLPEHVNAIAKALKDPEPQTRREAARALGMLPNDAKAYVPDLVGALRDKDIAVVRAAAAALADLKDAVTNKDLADMAAYLKDDDIQLRCNACLALAALGDAARSRIPDLIEALKDKQPEVVSAAAQALREVGDERALGPLNQALAVQKDTGVRFFVSQAIDQITKRAPERKDAP